MKWIEDPRDYYYRLQDIAYSIYTTERKHPNCHDIAISSHNLIKSNVRPNSIVPPKPQLHVNIMKTSIAM